MQAYIMDSVVCSPSYHSQGSQGSSLQNTLVLIISLREASLKCCCCKMYRPPCKGIGISARSIRNQAKPFFCLQNPPNDWNPENKFHQQKTRTVHGIRNPSCEIQNPAVLWIPSHGTKVSYRLPIQKNKHCNEEIEEKNQLIWQTAHLMHKISYI